MDTNTSPSTSADSEPGRTSSAGIPIVLSAILLATITPIALAFLPFNEPVAIELPAPDMQSAELDQPVQAESSSSEKLVVEYGVMMSNEEPVADSAAVEGVMDAPIETAQVDTWLEPAPEDLRGRSIVGVYLTPNSMSRKDFFIGTMEGVGAAGGNALIFDVKGSAVFFDADTPMARELGLVQKKYDLTEVLKMARERGIYTIGRFIAVKDAGITRVRPDTIISHPTTGRRIGYEFIDPENTDALEYNRQVICALARSGINEINLDYIRFSTEQVGALGVYSMEEKSRKVGTFVRMARETIDVCGPETKLGVSTYAILGWHYEKNLKSLGQDFVSWAPMLDIISPMAYPATFAADAYYVPGQSKGSRMYYLVWHTLEGYKELLGPEHSAKIRPWIQGYGVTSKNMKDQMQAVSDAGLCGFLVWNADNAYGVTYKNIPTFVRGEGCVGQ